MTKKLMMMFAAVAVAFGAWAETETVGGYTWTYQINGDRAEIYKDYRSPAISPSPTGAVTIPSTLGGKPVTSIGEHAFYECSGLTNVTIPNSVSIIESSAFSGCSGSLYDTTTIPGLKLLDGWVVGRTSDISQNLNLTGVRGIGNFALCECNLLTSVTINGAAYIGPFAFDSCDALTSVTINNVKDITGLAFRRCSALTRVTIGNNVMRIGSNAFEDCSSLTRVTIGNSVMRIGGGAFDGCSDALFDTTTISGVQLVDGWAVGYTSGIPRSLNLTGVRGIGDWAFMGCSALLHVMIPSSVTSIDGGMFDNCRSLESFVVASGNPNYKSVSGLLLTKDGKMLVAGVNGDVIIPDGVTDIAAHAFSGRRGLMSVMIPNSVTDIKHYAFYWCSSLTSAAIPDSVTSIGNFAFYKCSGLTSVTIPSCVTNIGMKAFCGCSGLTSVLLPKRFEGNLDESVFEGCPEDMVVAFYDSFYTINFHRNDASDEKTEGRVFDYGVATKLPTLAALGWERRGMEFRGWAESRANAAAGKVWNADGATVVKPVGIGETLDVYAVWALKPNSYAIQFIRNDGAGTWRTVGFNYGEKTRIPSLANGLGWARRGYDFKGWALTTADANADKVWKEDWAYVATPVKAGEVLTVYAVWALKPGYYQVRFNKNDGSGKWRTLGFECDKSTKLSTIAGLGWERPGYRFRGWASNKANADAGKVWKPDGAWVTNATAEGKTLSIYAIWE